MGTYLVISSIINLSQSFLRKRVSCKLKEKIMDFRPSEEISD